MKKKEKKKSSFAVLMHYAGGHKYYSYASAVLAVISAWIALIPFYDVWRIIKEILRVRPDFSKAENISRYGWEAVGFALLGMVIYIAALMCSHKAAFRVQANMRVSMMKHIMKLPLGYIETEGTGKIRKIVMDSSASTETYLAHKFPDKAVSMATPVGLLVMMFIFDWRLGLISLIPAFIAFVLMGTLTMGPKMAEDMKQYQNALEKMSSEAVEYVRGIPVVKTFGQTIFSFKRFKLAIDEYEKWTLGYTKNMMLPMICFTTAANGIFAALIIAAFKLTSHGVTDEFVLNLFFYVIITSILTVTLMKIAYAGESQMLVDDAVNRMYSILETEPLAETKSGETPKDSSIQLDNAVFAYDNAESNAVDGITMNIKAGEHIAVVGPSGGGKTTLCSLWLVIVKAAAAVRSAPARTPRIGFLNQRSTSANSGTSLRGATAPLIESIPNMSTAKPTSIDAISFFLSFLENVSIATPIIARIGENEDGLSILIRKLSPLSPDKDNIHAVTVVPIFAPIITPMAEWSFMMPAFTKPTSITVVAEED